MSDSVELLGYVAGFWLFIFSPRFRHEYIRNWQESGTTSRFVLLLEGLFSVFISVLLPLALLIALART